MSDNNDVNPKNGEFKHLLVDKGNLTDDQLYELITEYFSKKEKIIGRNLTVEEKISLASVFIEAIEEGKCNPVIILELIMPSTNKPFKQFTENDKPLEIQFTKPTCYE